MRAALKATLAGSIFMLLSIPAAADSADTARPSSDFYVVANINGELPDMNRRNLRNLFTLRRNIWPDGSPVQLVVLNPQHQDHHKFCEDTLGLLSYQVSRLWERTVFSSSALAPIIVQDYAQLVDVIANTKGSLGYVAQAKKEGNNESITYIAVD